MGSIKHHGSVVFILILRVHSFGKGLLLLASHDDNVDSVIFEKAVEAYSVANPDEILYIDDITNSVDHESIENPETSNLLEHNMALSNKLPDIVSKLKKKYK